MYERRRIAVVIPAFNEADKVGTTVQSVPAFVDHVIVVDDGSADDTSARARSCQRAGLEVLVHQENWGVGAAIATGYARARELRADITAVMAGDAQMDPGDLPGLLQAVIAGADYAKGNRFAGRGVWRVMPASRYFGNLVLSHLTRLCSGLWHVFDSQCGYTAISGRGLDVLLREPMFARYGYPNDVLVRLAQAGVTVVDVPVRAVYGPAWRSGIRPARVALPILRLLVRGAMWRWSRRMSHGADRAALLPEP